MSDSRPWRTEPDNLDFEADGLPCAIRLDFLVGHDGATKMTRDRLLVMRLADMRLVHPQQDNTKVCSECGYQVGIYPSGQAALRRDPMLTVVCQVCIATDAPERYELAPGAENEPLESIKRKQ